MKRPPKIADASSMSVSDEEREAFHYRLDALLNGRERIIRLSDPENEAPRTVIQTNRLDLVKQAAALISDVCRDWIKLSEGDADSRLEYVSMALRMWQPAIAMHDQHDYFWDDLIDEIERLPFGDQPELLKPAKRPPGSSLQPARMAFRRMTALVWSEYLKSKGVKPAIVKRGVSLAYGADWDAIRKWRGSIAKILGKNLVDRRLAGAAEGYVISDYFPDYHKALYDYGHAYREQAGLSRLDFEAYMTTVEGILSD